MYLGFGYWNAKDFSTVVMIIVVLVPILIFGTLLQKYRDLAKGIVTLIIVLIIIYDLLMKN